MSVGVMKDYKIKLRNLRASHKYGNTEDRGKKKEKEKILASCGTFGGKDALRIGTMTYRQSLFVNSCVGRTLGPYKLQANKHKKQREGAESYDGAAALRGRAQW